MWTARDACQGKSLCSPKGISGRDCSLPTSILLKWCSPDRWIKDRVVWRGLKTFEQKDLVPAARRGGENVMVWFCLTASGTGQLAAIDLTMNSAVYQCLKIMWGHLSECGSCNRIMVLRAQTHRGRSQQKEWRVMERPRQKHTFESHWNVVEGFKTGRTCKKNPQTFRVSQRVMDDYAKKTLEGIVSAHESKTSFRGQGRTSYLPWWIQ